MKTKIVLGISFILLVACISEPKVKVNLSKTDDSMATDSLAVSPYKIGVAAMLSPEEALPAYEEIVKYVGAKLDTDIEMLFTKDYAAMNKLTREKKVIAAFVCSGPYVQGHDSWGMQLIVAPSLHGHTSYYSYIIVNKNSRYNNLEDLKGKKFAFTDPKSNTGKLVPTYELLRSGKNPETFFSECIFTGSHDKSIEAVANNLVDGAAVDNLIWEYKNNIDPATTSKTRVIAKFGPFCSPPIVTYPECDERLKNNIKHTLLGMHKDPIGKEILKKILIDSFVVVNDDCYKSVRKMQNWIDKQAK